MIKLDQTRIIYWIIVWIIVFTAFEISCLCCVLMEKSSYLSWMFHTVNLFTSQIVRVDTQLQVPYLCGNLLCAANYILYKTFKECRHNREEYFLSANLHFVYSFISEFTKRIGNKYDVWKMYGHFQGECNFCSHPPSVTCHALLG